MNDVLVTPGERVALNLRFKGARTYLHGTDMVDEMARLAPGLTDLSLRIQKIATKPLAAVLLPDAIVGRKELVALLNARRGGEKIALGLLERDDGGVPGRYAYDEERVIAGAAVDADGRAARMAWNGEYSFVEQLVALHKALLQRCFASAGVHWYFTRLDIARLPASFGTLSLEVTQALGVSLVRSAIAIDDEALGDIYFSGVKQ